MRHTSRSVQVLQWLGVFIVVVVLDACGSGKEVVSEAQREAVRQMVESREFEFRGQWAMPLSGNDMNALWRAGLLPPGDTPNRIDLSSNPNYLKLNKDEVSAYLPFYGTQQFNVSLNSQDQAIQFDEEVNDLQVTYNKKKDMYDMRFTASKGTNGYVIFLTVFPNATATLRISSASRNNISYQGRIKALEKDKEEPEE